MKWIFHTHCPLPLRSFSPLLLCFLQTLHFAHVSGTPRTFSSTQFNPTSIPCVPFPIKCHGVEWGWKQEDQQRPFLILKTVPILPSHLSPHSSSPLAKPVHHSFPLEQWAPERQTHVWLTQAQGRLWQVWFQKHEQSAMRVGEERETSAGRLNYSSHLRTKPKAGLNSSWDENYLAHILEASMAMAMVLPMAVITNQLLIHFSLQSSDSVSEVFSI